jgi:hypothetical protein
VKTKIDSCSQTYNNFTLLYLQAEIFLIKRLINPSNESKTNSKTINESPSNANLKSPASTPTKKSFGDKILDLFRRPSNSKPNEVENNNDLFPQIQILNDFKMK